MNVYQYILGAKLVRNEVVHIFVLLIIVVLGYLDNHFTFYERHAWAKRQQLHEGMKIRPVLAMGSTIIILLIVFFSKLQQKTTFEEIFISTLLYRLNIYSLKLRLCKCTISSRSQMNVLWKESMTLLGEGLPDSVR